MKKKVGLFSSISEGFTVSPRPLMVIVFFFFCSVCPQVITEKNTEPMTVINKLIRNVFIVDSGVASGDYVSGFLVTQSDQRFCSVLGAGRLCLSGKYLQLFDGWR